MKAYFPCGYFPPEKAASIYLTDNIVEDTANSGVDVLVYTPIPTRGVNNKTRDYYKKNPIEYRCDGKLKIVRFSLYREGEGTLKRAFRYFICNFKHFWHGLTNKDDVYFVDSTPPTQGVIAGILKMLKGVKIVYNLQDIFPDSLVNNGLASKGGVLWKIGRVIENFTYKHADKIVVISEDFKKNIMAKGVPEDKIVVVYNWVDQNAVVDIPRDRNKLFDMYGLDCEKFYVTYNGNIGLSQNMDMLLDVAEDFQNDSTQKDIQFVLVGEGAYLNEVKRIVTEKELKNVHLIPFQPYDDISYVFSLADASLVISKPGTGAASVPSKTWSIMSASRPVLANFDENELKDIITDNNCGIFTKAGDKEAFKESILTLYNNRELARKMGENGRAFVMKNLTREVGTAKYVQVIKSVVKEKNK